MNLDFMVIEVIFGVFVLDCDSHFFFQFSQRSLLHVLSLLQVASGKNPRIREELGVAPPGNQQSSFAVNHSSTTS